MKKKVHMGAFNSKWRRFLFSKKNLSLLDGHGWNDGGCWTLAEAVTKWASMSGAKLTLNGLFTLAKKHSNRDILQHVLVGAGNHYLDGDGFQLSNEILQDYPKKELILEHVYLWPISDSCLIKSFNIETDPKTSNILSRRLQKRFGNFSDLIGYRGIGPL
jgi:hypothetical protein